ncbi:MAG: polysaccharide deacetylase family protein [Oscillospiraceae bacterium]|jgi:peptidoglycan/xylan/chitin deacetylase (PgdA/CDA1 family)|nr:polysaccharide deacetylase family protein [Oscillospiraceae bacterium]
MKRKIMVILLAFAMLIPGCAAPVAEPEATTGTPTPPATATPEVTPDSAAVYEYGDTRAIIDFSESLRCYLLYPRTGIDAIDAPIFDWAHGAYADAQEDMQALRKTDPGVEGEINVQYNSYLRGEAYACVEETGFYNNSNMAHQRDFVKVFNIDVGDGKILPRGEILAPESAGDVLELLRGKLREAFPELPELGDDADETWLENIALTDGGVDILLEAGRHLPSYLGTRRFALTYEELGRAFVLFDQQFNRPAAATDPTPEPTPEPTPPPTPRPVPPPGDFSPRDEIDPAKPMVALTFDDGPSGVTPRILDLLDEYGGKATFCVIGNRVENYADTVRRIAEEGSEIIGHSWDHKNLVKLSDAAMRSELLDTNAAIEAVLGFSPVLYRPPYGNVNDKLKAVSAELGLSLIVWSVDTLDWKTRDANKTCDAVFNDVRDGGIILCHDIYDETADAMAYVIPELIARGYQLVTVSELLSFSDRAVEAGAIYRNK